ncbi:MAG TPA: ABC transporter substrate-binding protein [Phototrophicaceae bacterium]|nr:ABC transporter substrate-binding protein [Phototrophicaceae bacterium]
MLKHWFFGWALVGLLLLVTPAAAQDGRGVITIVNPVSTGGLTGSLNPALCNNSGCQTLLDLLLPTLFALDPTTGTVTTAAAENVGLVLDPALQSGDTQTLKLRQDLTWTDGTPVTAYDVLYTYLALTSPDFASAYQNIHNQIVSIGIVDSFTLTIQYHRATCGTFTRANFPILPAHTFDSDFAATITAAGAAVRTRDEWYVLYPRNRVYETIVGHPFNDFPAPTAGRFRLDAIRPGQDVRLSAGNTAFVYTDLPEGLSELDYFLAGQSSLLINPPADRRDDLRATPGLQIVEFPGWSWDYINFTTLDPKEAYKAFTEDGQLRDLEPHPIFGDVRVRRAVQMAIDVNEIIEIAFQGNATPMASYLPPASWAYNPDLQPIVYDPFAAAHLLDEAGWRDANRDGVRECRDCLYAEPDYPFTFTLQVQDGGQRDIVSHLIERQLSQIGIQVIIGGPTDGMAADAYLQSSDAAFERADPDRLPISLRDDTAFTPQNSFGSYPNPEIEALAEQARTVSACNLDQRANLYRQIQTLLQVDQPYAFLYVRNEMVVAAPGLLNFDPLPGNPYRNLLDWVVTP